MQRVREKSSKQSTSQRLQSQDHYEDIESAVKAWEENVSEKAREMEDQIADKVCEVKIQDFFHVSRHIKRLIGQCDETRL